MSFILTEEEGQCFLPVLKEEKLELFNFEFPVEHRFIQITAALLQGIDLRVTLALRWRLLLLWLFMLVVSGALAYIIREVYQIGSEVQAQKSVEQTAQACAALQTEYSRSVKPGEDIVDRELMNAVLNVTLDDLPGVEGGFWHASSRFVAYAFPSHVGTEKKKMFRSLSANGSKRLPAGALLEVCPWSMC
ncbi:hypothetical protein SAMN05216404_1023 [Nitrosospira multiformis]|uniref:Uncharacterized protein n=1 Tax=Nitrosospira multiformis TaxID=1231 RepID=A0A1H8CMN3_9PROT|nr:hypothetical protein [Nitrosospira multiformis]SEM96300.1 hypothetical protein SAMN05216404_1023 [Nitrosospira multiformis]